MDRRQIGVKLTLDGLGLPFSIGNFDHRLILQKTIYLAQAAGVDLGYFYTWYLYGPYSPSLTKDAYAINSDIKAGLDDSDEWQLDDKSKVRLQKLKGIIPEVSSDKQRRRQLELLASVHFLIEQKQIPRKDADLIMEILKRYNKDFSRDEIQTALKELIHYELLRG